MECLCQPWEFGHICTRRNSVEEGDETALWELVCFGKVRFLSQPQKVCFLENTQTSLESLGSWDLWDALFCVLEPFSLLCNSENLALVFQLGLDDNLDIYWTFNIYSLSSPVLLNSAISWILRWFKCAFYLAMKFLNDHVVLWSSYLLSWDWAVWKCLKRCFNTLISEAKLALELVSSIHFDESTVHLIKQCTDSMICLHLLVVFFTY